MKHVRGCFSSWRHTAAWLLLLASITLGFGAIDLTPTPAQYSAEGLSFQQLRFQDDKQIVSYDLPRHWTYRFDAGRIILTPPQAPFAEAVIEALPMPKPQPFDDPTIKTLEQQTLSALPPDSDAPTITKSERNAVLLNSNLSYEIVISYKTLGSTFQRSVLFVNVPGTQLIFRLSARKGDFEALYHAFRASVLTWQWLDSAAAGPS